MKTKIEIINEVVEHIQDRGRSLREVSGDHGFNTVDCAYRSGNGNRCGFGMFCSNDGIDELFEGKAVQQQFHYHDYYLMENYRGHGIGFWKDIQLLHDDVDNWSGKKLTVVGEIHVKRLLTEYFQVDDDNENEEN